MSARSSKAERKELKEILGDEKELKKLVVSELQRRRQANSVMSDGP